LPINLLTIIYKNCFIIVAKIVAKMGQQYCEKWYYYYFYI